MSNLHMHKIAHNGKTIPLSEVVDLHIKALIATGDIPEGVTIVDSILNTEREYVSVKLSNGTYMQISWKYEGQSLEKQKLDS